ncbi:3-oxo-tetronate 4-phosphate decarboxylase [Pseudochelatococcus sp. B33]
MTEADLRQEIARLARSLFERGYSVGSAGNLSAAVADGYLITPTNSSLGHLDPASLSKIDRAGKHVDGLPPSKELPLHLAFYETRPQSKAVVHLHSTYATALSCLAPADEDDCLEPLTPYPIMRVGRLKYLPYTMPGSPETGALIRSLEGRHAAVLLGNHGPVVSGPDFASAVFAAEELEESAKLQMLLRRESPRHLSAQQIAALRARYGEP